MSLGVIIVGRTPHETHSCVTLISCHFPRNDLFRADVVLGPHRIPHCRGNHEKGTGTGCESVRRHSTGDRGQEWRMTYCPVFDSNWKTSFWRAPYSSCCSTTLPETKVLVFISYKNYCCRTKSAALLTWTNLSFPSMWMWGWQSGVLGGGGGIEKRTGGHAGSGCV